MDIKKLLFAAAVVLGAGSSQALTGGVSGTVALTNWVGYGFQYSASWDSSAVPYALSVSFNEHASSQFPNTGYFNVSLALGPTAPSSSFPALDAFDFVGSVKMSFVDLTTGLPAVPPAFPGAPFFGVSGYASSSQCGGWIPVTEGVRFSTPTCSQSATLNGDSALSQSSKQLTYELATSYHYRSGHFLSPTTDSSCASFDCMIPGHDRVPLFYGGLQVSVAAVDEPSTLPMMAAGCVATAAWLRRRRARSA